MTNKGLESAAWIVFFGLLVNGCMSKTYIDFDQPTQQVQPQ